MYKVPEQEIRPDEFNRLDKNKKKLSGIKKLFRGV